MRGSHYGRFSTEMQNPTSIDDQLRICRERCDREGWTFAGAYEDRAMTGTSHLRPGYQRTVAARFRLEFTKPSTLAACLRRRQFKKTERIKKIV
jgi:Resolvase, N terminal domain